MANGTQWLTEHLNETCGTEFSQFQVRDMLRRLAKEEKIPAKDRGARYDFSGEKDKTVKAVVKYVTSGQAEKDRRADLEKVKEKRETTKEKASAKKEKAAAPKKEKAAPKKEKAAEPVVDEDDDDLDDLD